MNKALAPHFSSESQIAWIIFVTTIQTSKPQNDAATAKNISARIAIFRLWIGIFAPGPV
jgi:hypothetical protein